MECPWGSWGSSSRGFLTARSIPHASPAGLRHTPTKRWGSVFPPPESGQSSDCSPQWKWCHVTQEGRSSKEHSFFPACPFRMLALGKLPLRGRPDKPTWTGPQGEELRLLSQQPTSTTRQMSKRPLDHPSHQPCRAAPAEVPNKGGTDTSCPHCILFEFFPHKIHKCKNCLLA